MDPIILRSEDPKGNALEAKFLPEKGMNLISYRCGEHEVIDLSTWNLFNERSAGLGAIIGPHFHHRRPESLPKLPDETLFPHIAKLKEKGIQEPFSHGIARYAPWKFEASENKIKGVLTGKDEWNGVPLSVLEGQNFKMNFSAELKPTGLEIEMSVVSDTDSLVGLHYYYHLPEGKGRLVSRVKDQYLDKNERKEIPPTWSYDAERKLTFDLNQPADYGFHPFPNPLKADITLETPAYNLDIKYECQCQENAWQLYRPENASYVCIEPVSAQDPRHPNLTVSSIKVTLQISPLNQKGLLS